MGESRKHGLSRPTSTPHCLRIVEDDEDMDSIEMDIDDSAMDDEPLLPPYSPASFADSPQVSEDGCTNLTTTKRRSLDQEPEHLQNDLFTLSSLESRGTLGKLSTSLPLRVARN